MQTKTTTKNVRKKHSVTLHSSVGGWFDAVAVHQAIQIAHIKWLILIWSAYN